MIIYKKFENSSQLFSATYDNVNNELLIKFQKGYTYRYFEVPEEIYTALREAESAGAYFNKNIAKKFKYERI